MKKSITCPVCGETYEEESFGHQYDAVIEHGKCCDCLGHCPYCEECNEEPENMVSKDINEAASRLDVDASFLVDIFYQLVQSINKEVNGEPLDGDDVESLSKAFESYAQTYYGNN